MLVLHSDCVRITLILCYYYAIVMFVLCYYYVSIVWLLC